MVGHPLAQALYSMNCKIGAAVGWHMFHHQWQIIPPPQEARPRFLGNHTIGDPDRLERHSRSVEMKMAQHHAAWCE